MTLYYIMTVFVKLRTKERKETIHLKKKCFSILQKSGEKKKEREILIIPVH